MASSSSAAQPPCLCASAVHVANFVSAKLQWLDEDSNNYNSWKEQMLCLFESQGLLDFIDEAKNSEKLSASDNNDVISRRTDRLVKGWILGALSDEVVQTLATCDGTAIDVWLQLENMFTESQGSAPPSPPSTPQEEKGRGRHKYLPLYRAALSGDWVTAKRILDEDIDAAKASIAFNLQTALHVAAGTGKHILFVANLVNMMSDDFLAQEDEGGNNALHIAATTRNTAAARILIGKRRDLLYVKSKTGNIPVEIAAMSGHRETIEFFISETKDDRQPNPYTGPSGVVLLSAVIDAQLFDIALDLVEKYPHLAGMTIPSGHSALSRIACRESAFYSGARFNFVERLIYLSVKLEIASERKHATANSRDVEDPTDSILARHDFQRWHALVQYLHSTLSKFMKHLVPKVKEIHDKKVMHHQALKLAKRLCKLMESLSPDKASVIYGNAMATAASLGIHEVIEVIVETFPEAIYSRHQRARHFIFDLADPDGNTLLHLAAYLAPVLKLNAVPGAALQMQREIQWFKEVEKFVDPCCRGFQNAARKTPEMIFTEEHEKLKAEGEKWMKETANSCTIAAALIATVVFAAAITVPGGNQSDNGYPVFHKSSAFIIFAISDAISLFTSTTSLLLFLSILTSRYAEEDFLDALPKRLCTGLVTLFLSILFMMVAFSATLFLVFGRKHAWVLLPVIALACLPVTSFVLLQSPLLRDVVSSTYGRGIFRKQSDRPFY